jgi:hypothetical protein
MASAGWLHERGRRAAWPRPRRVAIRDIERRFIEARAEALFIVARFGHRSRYLD